MAFAGSDLITLSVGVREMVAAAMSELIAPMRRPTAGKLAKRIAARIALVRPRPSSVAATWTQPTAPSVRIAVT
jgi:hypothetical protein